MRKKYIKPAMEVVAQQYGEGVMQTISMPVSTVPSTAQDSKPGDSWGESPNDESWGDTTEW